MRWMLQVTEVESTRERAQAEADWLLEQGGAAAARVVGDGVVRPWTAQAFFEDEPCAIRLPDGVRRVVVLESVLASCRRAS